MAASNPTGRFFPVHMESIRRLLSEGCGANELGAYLVLCRGAGKLATTAWTEHAIATHLGTTRGKVVIACTWLQKHGFIEQMPKPMLGASEGHANLHSDEEGKEKPSRASRHRWRVCKEGSEIVYLPNHLIDGLDGNVPPILALFRDVLVDLRNGITVPFARLDALALLLLLYEKQDVAQFGGIDPKVWHKNWIESNFRDEPCFIEDPEFRLLEISPATEGWSTAFIDESFSHVIDKRQRRKRYQLAFANLERAGMVYEVLQIWSHHPIESERADVSYPLYIFDTYARNNQEPSLHKVITKVAIAEYSSQYGEEYVFDHDRETFGAYLLHRNGNFRFVRADWSPNAVALSVYRLRHRAHDRDTGIGMNEQQQMVEYWSELLGSRTLPDDFDPE